MACLSPALSAGQALPDAPALSHMSVAASGPAKDRNGAVRVTG